MILEFVDGTQIEVEAIFGGPRLINGVMRDTLRIEVSPNTIGFDDLKSLFKNNPATSMLYSYTNNIDEEGNAITEKNTIGEGYNIFVSISDETRKVVTPPGMLLPDKLEDIFIVTIAQMTYQEYHETHQDSEEEVKTESTETE